MTRPSFILTLLALSALVVSGCAATDDDEDADSSESAVAEISKVKPCLEADLTNGAWDFKDNQIGRGIVFLRRANGERDGRYFQDVYSGKGLEREEGTWGVTPVKGAAPLVWVKADRVGPTPGRLSSTVEARRDYTCSLGSSGNTMKVTMKGYAGVHAEFTRQASYCAQAADCSRAGHGSTCASTFVCR